MKSLVFTASLALLIMVVIGKPSPLAKLRSLPAIKYIDRRSPNNEYELKYETAEGTIIEESGVLREGANHTVYLYRSGKSTWTDSEGVTYETTWYSDETGYHAQGPHLPINHMPKHELPRFHSSTLKPTPFPRILEIVQEISNTH